MKNKRKFNAGKAIKKVFYIKSSNSLTNGIIQIVNFFFKGKIICTIFVRSVLLSRCLTIIAHSVSEGT